MHEQLSDADMAGFDGVDQLTREAAHLQVGMARARQFPRSEPEASAKLLRLCGGSQLAPRAFVWDGDGFLPSDDLLEAAAACWRNLEAGSTLSDGHDNELRVQGYVFDLETGVRRSTEATVRAAGNRKMQAALIRSVEASVIARLIPRRLLEEAVETSHRKLRESLRAGKDRRQSWAGQLEAMLEKSHQVGADTLKAAGFNADTDDAMLEMMGMARALEQGWHPAEFGLWVEG